MLKISRPTIFLLLISLSSMTAIGRGPSLPSHCLSSAVRNIQVPIHHQRTKTFTYRFSVSEREDPEAPLLIFIPGGPGQTSMDMALSYPYELAIVRTDPRGMGCNENKNLGAESLSSEAIAKDILAIIRELKPKRYFIHGISHGTMVATMVAAMAEGEKVPLPEAVILEGTIGRAFNKNEYLNGALERWKNLQAQLPQSLKFQLSQKPLPFNLSPKQFAAWVSSILIYGTLPSGSDYAFEQLMLLDPSTDQDHKEGLRSSLKRLTSVPSASKTKMYKEIVCREFVPDVRDVKFDFNWVNGSLVPTDSRLCQGLPFDRPYDASSYVIKSPIYYFSGELDPVTPLSHVRYHYDSQVSPRTLITVELGGHTALSTNLSDCSENIWKTILQNNLSELKKTLKACALKTQIKITQ